LGTLPPAWARYQGVGGDPRAGPRDPTPGSVGGSQPLGTGAGRYRERVPTGAPRWTAVGSPAVRVALVWVVLMGLLVLVGEVIVHSAAVGRADLRLTTAVVAHRTPALNHDMRIVTWVGSAWAPLALVAVVGILARRRRLLPVVVVVVAVAWLGEVLGVWLVKYLVARPRPRVGLGLTGAHGWSFPSGHAATAGVVFVTAAVLVVRSVDRRAVRVAVWTGAGLTVAAVAYSRIELGVHWTTDVVVGAAFAGAWVVAVFTVLDPPGVRKPPAGDPSVPPIVDPPRDDPDAG
jgi:membrane-associated phospholipid phosphatase